MTFTVGAHAATADAMLHVDMSMSEAKRCEACCGTDGVLLLTRCTAPNSVFRGHWRVDLSGEHSVSDDCHGRAARSVCRCCWRIGLRRPATVGRLGNHQSRESAERECSVAVTRRRESGICSLSSQA